MSLPKLRAIGHYGVIRRMQTPPFATYRRYEALHRHQTALRSFSSSQLFGEAGRDATGRPTRDASSKSTSSETSKSSSTDQSSQTTASSKSSTLEGTKVDWEDNPDFSISNFSQLPHTNFGVNQHMLINDEVKEALRQVLWQFRAPIRYAFAYGSGVFPQSKPSTPSSTPSSRTSIHPNAPAAIAKAQDGQPKMIDFIFGVSYTEHWHSLNLQQHRDHYSGLGSLGSGAVTSVQEKFGAGVYFNPYVNVNGMLIKYGVVNLDTLCTDLSEWSTLYIAGRLHKPVKILRDDPRVRLANQINLLSALRTSLLLLPPSFTEMELYGTIAGISYMGDPRMALPTEDPSKVANIVGNNLPNFRRLYAPLIENLPNVEFHDPACSRPDWAADPNTNARLEQDMDPVKRGNMVRRLPKAFRSKLYFQFQKKFQIPQLEFNTMMEQSTDEDAVSFKRRVGGGFEQRIAQEPADELTSEIRGVIKKTIGWPSTVQSLKGIVTGGFGRTYRYMSEKMDKHAQGKKKAATAAAAAAEKEATVKAAEKESSVKATEKPAEKSADKDAKSE